MAPSLLLLLCLVVGLFVLLFGQKFTTDLSKEYSLLNNHISVHKKTMGKTSPPTHERNGVVILGMHRSGTSMLSGLLVEGCGYHVGKPLIPAGPANPKGFVELLPVVLQNDALLKKQRAGWNFGVHHYDNDKAIQHVKSGQVDFQKGNKALKTLFDNPNYIPYLQKDPRMCITLPTWLPLLNKEPAVVLTYRHPLQVAMSLQKREQRMNHSNFGLERTMRLWINYNMRAIQNSQTLCRVYTSNHAILMNPLEEVQRISKELTTKCRVPRPPHFLTREIVQEFVNPHLQQQQQQQNETENRVILADHDGCKVYDFNSTYKDGPRHEKEVNMYKIAMKIYCDMESGKAYEANYEWPEL